MNSSLSRIIRQYNADPTRLMDILLDCQSELGCISGDFRKQIASELDISEVDVEQTMSFYHFLSSEPRGKYTVYLNNSVVAKMFGYDQIVKAFQEEAGCGIDQVSPDGLIGLFNTSCIGMNDQEPAALINGIVFPRLTTYKVKELVKGMRMGKSVEELQTDGLGDGNNASELLKSTVTNNIRKKGPVIFSDYTPGDAIKKMINSSPEEIISLVKKSGVRGRGGAGFPTGLKWEFCRKSKGTYRYVFCNADEGEPGTFKDRVILTEYPTQLFEGMVIAGYAVGSNQGILYLRFEYRYLKNFLEKVLEEMRAKNLLGKSIGGKDGFDFDIRIQFGAGAYVCGEESALIESAEGKRGEPRDRPPFPAEKGYLDSPTVINNVETLCSVVKIVLNGSDWYRSLGTAQSAGTKVISISGDCQFPGIYEVEWGFNIHDLLEMVGAEDVQGVQVGGPSGYCIGPDDFDRTLAYEDLSTGGSIIIFNNSRNLLKDVVLNFTEFFIDESCGSCAPCRYMSVLLKQKLQKILSGTGVPADLRDLEQWSSIMPANRCGLGQTAANPIRSTLKNFRHLYVNLIRKDTGFDTGFNLTAAEAQSCAVAGRKPSL